MTIRVTLAAVLLLSIVFPGGSHCSAEQPTKTATGVIFKDNNNDGVLDNGDTRLGNVRVSNGREIVRTDERGEYELPVDDDTTIFVIKPPACEPA